MPEQNNHNLRQHDGVGQRDRLNPALLPEYFPLDGRSTADLVRFARALGQQLKYIDFNGDEAGTWSRFLGVDDPGDPVSAAEIASFLEEPARFDTQAEKKQWLSRPHLALLLVFFDLLRLERDEINRFTRRHLDYYYRDVLGLRPRPAEADAVHLLIEPAKGIRQHLLEKNTLLLAGKTPEGRNRLFTTTEDIVVGRAKVAALKTFFQDRLYRSFDELVADPKNIEDGRFLKVALGDPATGYRMPPYPADSGKEPIFTDLVKDLQFSKERLFLSLGELRRFMTLKEKTEGMAHNVLFSEDAGIKGINFYLQEAWETRPAGSKPPFALTANNWDFMLNFELVTGTSPFPTASPNTFTANFQGIRHVQDLYERIIDLGYTGTPDTPLTPVLNELHEKIKTHLYFPDIHRFMSMMRLFQSVQEDWKRLNVLLLKAGRGKNPDFSQPPNWRNWQTRASDVYRRLTEALGQPFDVSGYNFKTIEVYWEKILELERYFQLNAEEVLSLLEIWAGKKSPQTVQLVELLKRAQRKTTLQREATALKGDFGQQQQADFTKIFPKIFEQCFGSKGIIPSFGDAKDTAGTLAALYAGAAKEDAGAQQYIRDKFFMNPRDFIAIWGAGQKPKPSTVDTDHLYQIVAEAIRRKNDQPLFSGEIIHQGLFSAPDASLLRTGRPGENHPRWSAFGQKISGDAGEPAPFESAQIGFAIQSPLLWLAGGTRTITLTIRFSQLETIADPLELLEKNFDYWLSNEKEPQGIAATWKSATWGNADSKELTIALELPADQPAVTAPHPDFFRATDPVPVLKIRLKQDAPTGDAVHVAMSAWVIQSANLSVGVTGLMPDAAWNDDGEVDAKRPFEPFGAHPRVGSRFRWTNTEALNKPLDKLEMQFAWMGKPGNWNERYEHFQKGGTDTSPITANSNVLSDASFTVSVETADAYGNVNAIAKSLGLFPSGTYTPVTLPPTDVSKLQHAYQVILNLDTDFKHDEYLLKTAVATMDSPRLKPPYTPKVNAFALNYKTKDEPVGSKEQHRFFHLTPFGHSLPEEMPGSSFTFLPALPGEGVLYIGLQDAEAPCVVSLLFQVAEGTADPDAERRPLRWQYLSAGGWRSGRGGENPVPFLLEDDTDGLNRSGIIRFRIPEDASDSNPEMPPGRHWLRVAVDFYRRSVCDLIDVQAQAVRAVRVLAENSADDPGMPLPAGSLTGLAQRRPEIRALRQPYTSRGGRSPEPDSSFYTRVSERLRHKQRALAAWDIERLVLQAFPDIYKVKCLPAGSQPGARPGAVDVVVIPDLRGRLPMDPFQPRLAQARLQEIGQWLQARAPIPALYRARNARFLELKVEATVQFHAGSDPGYYRGRLSDELAEYLSPWAFDAGAEIRFGGRIYPAEILAFIENRPYIDFVSDLKFRAVGLPESTDIFTPLELPGADTVWVSSPRHDIRMYAEIVLPATPSKRGVGYGVVGVDFEIA